MPLQRDLGKQVVRVVDKTPGGGSKPIYDGAIIMAPKNIVPPVAVVIADRFHVPSAIHCGV